MKSIVFCSALPQEIKPLCRRLRIPAPNPQNPVIIGKTVDGCAVRMAVSGVGRDRMSARIQQIPKTSNLTWVSIGFAGALSPDLAAGDCIIGHTVACLEGTTYAFQHQSVGEIRETDVLLCSDRVIRTPEEKQTLHRKTGAMAVDMESAAIAQYAQQRGESFTWIRVISDTVYETVSPAAMDCIGPDGFPSTTLALKTLLMNPRVLPEFLRLAIRSGKCASRLAEAVLPWMLLFHSSAD